MASTSSPFFFLGFFSFGSYFCIYFVIYHLVILNDNKEPYRISSHIFSVNFSIFPL